MNQSILSVRVNSNDKKKFEKFCSEAGMNVSTAINMFIKATNREKKLPFEVKSKNYDEYIFERIKEAEAEYKKNGVKYTKEEVYESLMKSIDKK